MDLEIVSIIILKQNSTKNIIFEKNDFKYGLSKRETQFGIPGEEKVFISQRQKY